MSDLAINVRFYEQKGAGKRLIRDVLKTALFLATVFGITMLWLGTR